MSFSSSSGSPTRASPTTSRTKCWAGRTRRRRSSVPRRVSRRHEQAYPMLDVQGLAAALALVLALLAVSWGVRRSTSTTLDFYLARRQVGPFLNASAICGDYFSAASFLGVAGAVYASGLDGIWFATGFAAGFVVVLLFLAAPFRRAGRFSIPDFLAHRFDSQPIRVASVVIVQIIVLLYLIPQMTASGLIWEVFVGRGLGGR